MYASILNQTARNFVSANTGVNNLSLNIDRLIGVIAVPKGSYATQSQTATAAAWQAYLTGLTQNSNKFLRAYPIGRFVDAKESNNTDQKETLPYGGDVFLARGITSYTCRMVDGGMDNFQNWLKGFHNQQGRFDFYLVMNDNTTLGSIKTVAGAPVFAPVSLRQIWVPGWDLPQSNSSAIYNLVFTISNTQQLNEQLGFVEANFDIFNTLIPFTDVTLTGQSTATPGLFNCQAFAGYSNEDMSLYFSTPLAATSLWSAINTATGLAIAAPTGVTAISGGWAVQLNHSDANFPASGGSVTLTLAGPAALTAAGVATSQNGFECVQPVTIIVP